jgi:hypothetical protein
MAEEKCGIADKYAAMGTGITQTPATRSQTLTETRSADVGALGRSNPG